MKGDARHPVIVIGARGFIGRAVVEQCTRDATLDVHAISSQDVDLTAPHAAEVLTDLLVPHATVVCTAALRPERDDSPHAFHANVAMAVNVARSLTAVPSAQCIAVSTVSVYGRASGDGVRSEETPIAPDTPYALAKYVGECVLARACADAAVPLTILRLPRVYGPFDRYAQYGPSAFAQAAVRGAPIRLFGDGSELRELMYVEDAARVIHACVHARVAGVVNVVSGTSHRLVDAASVIAMLLPGTRMETAPRTGPAVDERYDGQRLADFLPEIRFTSLHDGLVATVAALAHDRATP